VSVYDDGESLRLEAYEAERWHRLVELFLDRIPEIRPDPSDDDRVVSPGWVWCRVVDQLLDADGSPRLLDSDVWTRVLSLLEVVVTGASWLEAQEGSGTDDVTLLWAFAETGIVCDVTRNLTGLQALLPRMGELTVEAARREVRAHSESRGFGETVVDWDRGSTEHARAAIDPAWLLPTEAA
jgi:hypothetical protein